MEFIVHFFLQLLFSVGIIVVFGFLIAFCRRMFVKILGYTGYKILLATGIVGTPVHELSHALMCVVFGHKINEIKLYNPNSEDGTLGYVNHSYNPKNLYHQVGNFFIAIAPIVCGSAVLLLLLFLLVPNTFDGVISDIQSFSTYTNSMGGRVSPDVALKFFAVTFSLIKTIFTLDNLTNVLWWIFIILALMIAGHMELSGADIKGGLGGFVFVLIVFFVVDLVLSLISTKVLSSFSNIIISAGLFMACVLMLAALFCVALLLIALIVKGISKLVRKR